MRELGALVRDALDQSYPPNTAPARPSDKQSASERISRSTSVRPSAIPPGPPVTSASSAVDRISRGDTAQPPSVRPSGQASAERASRVPERTSVRSERPSIRPERQSVGPERTSVGPERTSALPERTSVRPERASVRPESTANAMRDGASGAIRVARGRMKGTAVRTGLLWFAERHGMETVAGLWERSSPELQALIRLDDPSFGIVASGWYDTRLLGELLAMLEDAAGVDDGDAWASDLAEAIAKDNVAGVYRSLFRLITTPAMLEANAQRVWRTYCDEGILVVNAPRAGELQLEIRYWTHHHAQACRVVGYAIQHVLRAVGYEALVIERTQCISAGDRRARSRGCICRSDGSHSPDTYSPRRDLLLQRIDLPLHVVRDRRAVRAVADVAHRAVAQAELVDARLEAPLGYRVDRVEHRDVRALHHARQHASPASRAYWSESTPIANTCASCAASNTP